MNLFARLIAALVLLPALLAPLPARAVDYCVQTQSEFQTVLAVVETLPFSNRLLLGAGKTFQIAGTALVQGDSYGPLTGNLVIEGGYNADCSAQSTRDAASTVLAGTAALTSVYISTTRNITLSTLTVTGLPSAWFYLSTHYNSGATGQSFVLSRVRFLDVRAVTIHPGDESSNRVENSLFANGSSGLILDAIEATATVTLVGNTFTRQQSSGVWVTTLGDSSLSVIAYNNILYGNRLAGNSGDADLEIDSSGDASVLAYNNIVGTRIGSYAAGSANNLSSDPLFVSGSNFNTQPASPARDSGSPLAQGGIGAYDIEGGPRAVGVVDRGAYEADTSGATILLVTNTNDSGAGSLRAAITEANADPNYTIIGFNISGACPRTIALQTALPAITHRTSIRGYSQTGSASATSIGGLSGNNATICVELRPATGVDLNHGLRFSPADPANDFLDVSGLSIGGFTGAGQFPVGYGIRIDEGNFAIQGNFIGLAANSDTMRANTYGIRVAEPATARTQNLIGGEDPGQSNLIAGSLQSGIDALGPVSVINNFIGTSRSGNVARPNNRGIRLGSTLSWPYAAMRNRVEGNLISGNTGPGILSSSSVTGIEGNRIGQKRLCIAPCDWALPNGGSGIGIVGADGNAQFIYDNTIAYNDGDGIYVINSRNIRINQNSIHSNAELGIDLGNDGVDPIDNDATAPADAPNRRLNFPYPTAANGGLRSGQVTGFLLSTNGTYRIELFANDAPDNAGAGEGRHFVGSATVTIDNAPAGNNGQVDFTIPIAWTANLDGKFITATAAENDFYGMTSEFSTAVVYQFNDVIFANGFESGVQP